MIIDPSDMPSNWHIDGYKYNRYHETSYNSHEMAGVEFRLSPPNENIMAMHNIFVFKQMHFAKVKYKRSFTTGYAVDFYNCIFPQGYPVDRFNEWTFRSDLADEQFLGCRTHTDPDYCIWVARYDEYIVEFRTRVGGIGMSVEEFQGVVKRIDSLVEEKLYGQ